MKIGNRFHFVVMIIIVLVVSSLAYRLIPNHVLQNLLTSKQSTSVSSLPKPRMNSETSIEQALAARRSHRLLKDDALPLAVVSQLVWAAQGITNAEGGRTAPSAGALYPLSIYVLAFAVTDLAPGMYRYLPKEHILQLVEAGDLHQAIFDASEKQPALQHAAFALVIVADTARSVAKYGMRGVLYAAMEAGHVAENVYLEAVAEHVGTVSLAGMDEVQVKQILKLKTEDPLYIMPVGRF